MIVVVGAVRYVIIMDVGIYEPLDCFGVEAITRICTIEIAVLRVKISACPTASEIYILD
jgi:hypothetical protein